MATTKSKSKSKAEDAPGPVGQKEIYTISAANLPTDWDNQFNSREPKRNAKAYLSMRDTLRDNPESFFRRNGGIHKAGKHVLDGGHTYLAIWDAIKEDKVDPKRIHITITDYGDDLSTDEMADLSTKLNNRTTPPLAGVRDVLGEFDRIKEHVHKEELFEFRSNSRPDAPYEVTFLIGLMDAWKSVTAEKSYLGKGNLVRLFTNDKYALFMPLLPTMQKVYSHIYARLIETKEVTKEVSGYKKDKEVILPDGRRVAGELPESYIWPIFGALRSLVQPDGTLSDDPIALLDSRWKKVTKQLITDYRRLGSNPGSYGRDKQSYLYMMSAVVSKQ